MSNKEETKAAEEQVKDTETQTEETKETQEAEKQAEETAEEQTEETAEQQEETAAQEENDDRYIRLMAEFENFRKRTDKEKQQMFEIGAKSVIEKILPVVDNFERALKSMEESEASDSAKMGTELIYKQLIDVLKKKGVTEIEALGKELDTDEQEAVAQIPAPSEDKKGKVVDVVVKGYKLNGKVIRFAKVVIGV